MRILAIALLLPSLAHADLSVGARPPAKPRSTAIRVACEELVASGFDGYDRIVQRLGGSLWLQMGISGGNVYFVSDPLFDTMQAVALFGPGVSLNLPSKMGKRPTLDELLRASDARASRSHDGSPLALIVRTSSGGACSMQVSVDREGRVISVELVPIGAPRG
jgi:hypothetical protein